ncbi:uncharacterized protein LOC117172396 [Belonocnema kinseyi]|uniref:uncharacterized protein LOC117172396 n=1 Tax=Belonocnema kinseyi TaxID=2817044 RepID=UPI00143CDC83|nr:uncharacterized protein LOC117172396 [Belonocnema kinseyi]
MSSFRAHLERIASRPIHKPTACKVGLGQEHTIQITKSADRRQPFLVCTTGTSSENEGPFFIMVGLELISVCRNSIQAFDLLFQLHYWFYIEYANELIHFYNFIGSLILK